MVPIVNDSNKVNRASKAKFVGYSKRFAYTANKLTIVAKNINKRKPGLFWKNNFTPSTDIMIVDTNATRQS